MYDAETSDISTGTAHEIAKQPAAAMPFGLAPTKYIVCFTTSYIICYYDVACLVQRRYLCMGQTSVTLMPQQAHQQAPKKAKHGTRHPTQEG